MSSSNWYFLGGEICINIWVSQILKPCRKHPIVLPHNVVGDWPEIREDDIRQYWNHLAQRGSPLANISPERNHIPIWLWGDECEFRENGEEITVIAFGCAIDSRKYSAESCYPLCLCRTETFMHCWLFKFCYLGGDYKFGFPSISGHGVH